MKKLLWLVLLVAFLPKMAGAYGVVRNASASQTSEDSLVFPVLMPDSMGNPIGKIDSIFIMVIGPSGDSVKAEKIAGIAAGTNWTSYIKRGAAIGWDSLTFVKCQVSNIVVTGSPGVYTVIIQGYAAAGGSTAKRARYAYQFQYVKATLSQTLYAVLDTLLRPTVKGRTLDVASTGEAGMDFSNINGTLDSTEVGATLGSFIANHSDSANNKLTYDSIKVYDNWIRDSVHNQSVAVLASAASAVNLTKVIDTVNGILDTLQLYDNWIRDSVHNQSVAVNAVGASAANLTKVIDTVNGIMDTLQLHDNWLRDSVHNQSAAVIAVTATAANLTKAIDSINAILDTLQLYDNWVRDSVHNQSAAVIAVTATAANLTKAIDSVNAILDTLQLYDTRLDSLLAAAGNIPLRTWNLPYNTAWTAGSIGDSANNNGFYGPGGGTGLDSATTSRILKRVLYGIATGSGSDSTTLATRLVTATVSAGGMTATQDKRLAALYFKASGDTLNVPGYVWSGGDNSDGTTWAKAYKSPNYIGLIGDSNRTWYIAGQSFDTVHISIKARNVKIIGSPGTKFVADTLARRNNIQRVINVFKPDFYVSGVTFISSKDSFSYADEDSLYAAGFHDPWPSAIEFWGTAHNGTVERCDFPRQNYKSIVSIDTTADGLGTGVGDTARACLNLRILNNTATNNLMYFADVNPDGALISGNRINGIRSAIDNGSAGIQLFTRARNVVITGNFFDSLGIAVAMQGDKNTIISHNNYGYFHPWGARFTNSTSSVGCVIDEPTLFPNNRDYANLFKDPGLEDFTTSKTTLTGTGWDAPYLSYNVGTGDTFPDARIVSAKSRSGAYSWYANTRTTGTQVTFGLDTFSFWLDTGTYVASAYVYAADGSTTSIKIRDWQQNDSSLLNVTLGSPADSTYQVTTWSAPDTNRWTQVQAKFTHNRLGRVKVQFITHDNSICYWDDFSFTKVSTFQHLTDSVLVDMSSFNNSLDDDSTLVKFLRGAQQQVVSIPLAIPIYGGVFSQYTFAEASARLDSMRYAVYRQMNLPVTGTNLVSPAVVNGIINQAIQTVSTNFPAIEKIDTVIVTISGEGAALNNDFVGIHRVTRILGDTLRVILDTLPPGSQNSQFTTTGGEANMLQNLTSVLSPKYYGIFRKQIQLYPKYMKPTGYTDSLLIEYYANGKYLSVDSMQTDIPASYRDAVWYLTLANLYALRSMYTDAGYWVAQYNALNPKKFLAMPKYEQGAIQR